MYSRKDRVVTHLRYNKNGQQMQAVALYQCQGLTVKALFARYGGVWPTNLNDMLGDFVNDRGGNDVVGFQQ